MLIDLETAVDQIQQGQVIAYPTEAVYGLGCDPFNQQAFKHLLKLKQRPFAKGVILIASNLRQIKDLAIIFDQAWSKTVLKSWESALTPTTWILPATTKAPHWITGGRDTVAIRLSHHPVVKSLCDRLDSCIVSTSANTTQQPPAKTENDCQAFFETIGILKGSVSGLENPSEIWDAQTMRQLR